MKHLLSVTDIQQDIFNILQLAEQLKKDPWGHQILDKKVLAMIFEKASTRTRISFEVAMFQLGGHALFLSKSDLQLGRGELIEDTSRVMSRYVDGVMIRAVEHSDVVNFAQHSDVPVINGLTNLEHPCQALTDIFTIFEKKKTYRVHLTFVGDGNNVCNSLLLASSLVGMDMTVVCPERYEPDVEIINKAKSFALKSGSQIEVTNNISEGIKDADVVYTDVWVSMGEENETDKRLKVLNDYQVNSEILNLANPDAIVMHCLPAIRGQEITEDVISCDQSAIWDQAENRLHVQKAILYTLLGKF
ncbi:MAG: Ornithine carbamoyltransferase [Methanobacterium sp. PtaU1.Bin242]|nr:MAG: Ornithine carbamoyltransferase [Methanobacterium sp. PtaU1.Bin242]